MHALHFDFKKRNIQTLIILHAGKMFRDKLPEIIIWVRWLKSDLTVITSNYKIVTVKYELIDFIRKNIFTYGSFSIILYICNVLHEFSQCYFI